jgi:hypothetical protein
MIDRGFNEIDLRRMLHIAQAYRKDEMAGRWVVESRHPAEHGGSSLSRTRRGSVRWS